jgi:hypothetical protein
VLAAGWGEGAVGVGVRGGRQAEGRKRFFFGKKEEKTLPS